MAVRDVRWEQPPYGASVSLISWLAGDAWIAASGEYAFYNGGAWLGDVPAERLVEIAYFLIRRETFDGIVTKEVGQARQRAQNRLDSTLETSGDDDATGLPKWVVQQGVGPADGSLDSPFG